MKTAISIPVDLFQEVEKFAQARHISRSEVFVTAVREYLEKQKAKNLLDEINVACLVSASREERCAHMAGKRRYFSMIRKNSPF